MRRAGAVLIGLAVLDGGCAPYVPEGATPRPGPSTTRPQFLDPGTIYREMGFIVSGPPLPFVGAMRYLATPTPDSTLGVFALSLANQALAFRRGETGFTADYHVELSFRTAAPPETTAHARTTGTAPEREAVGFMSSMVARVDRDETIRVSGFRETLRSDESVIFQHFITLAPGSYVVSVMVRDRTSAKFTRQEQPLVVPRFGGGGVVSSPVPIYDGVGRDQLTELPRLVINPRATLRYGGDTLRFYLEVYGAETGAQLAARALDASDAVVWRDTVPLRIAGPLGSAQLRVVPAQLPLGRARLEVGLVGRSDSIRAPLLVSVSDNWIVTNFDQMVSLLRFFERQDWVRRLAEATPADRPQVWSALWKETDPSPHTPENEALSEYFRRVREATGRFGEEGHPGWLTDRGEVFITLGEPDEVLDTSSDANQGGGRLVRWTYTDHKVILFFADQSGFGRLQLTPASRGEFQRLVARIRTVR